MSVRVETPLGRIERAWEFNDEIRRLDLTPDRLASILAGDDGSIAKAVRRMADARPPTPFAQALAMANEQRPIRSDDEARLALGVLLARLSEEVSVLQRFPEVQSLQLDTVSPSSLLLAFVANGTQEGADLLALLSVARRKQRFQSIDQDEVRTFKQRLRARIPASERWLDQPAPEPPPLNIPRTSFAKPRPPDPVTAARAVAALSKLPLSTLAEHLSFGTADVRAWLLGLALERPNTALGRQVLEFIPPKTEAGLIAALLTALFPFRTPEGVDWSKFCEAYGDEGRELAARLERVATWSLPPEPNYQFLAAVVDALGKKHGAEAVPLVDAVVRTDRLIPASLPALDRAKGWVPDDRFDDRGLIAFQHGYPTLVPFLEAFVEKGMNPSHIHVLFSAYNPNPLVAVYCRLRGFQASMSEDFGGATRDFEETKLWQIAKFLDTVALSGSQPPKGFEIVDDGGALHASLMGFKDVPEVLREPLHRARRTILANDPHGTEQTTRGLTELGGRDLAYEVTKVADAPGKIKEGKLIGWALAGSMLRERAQSGYPFETITMLGAGTVGLQAAEQLRGLDFQMRLVDPLPERQARAKERGFPVAGDVTPYLEDSDFILGATGKPSFEPEKFRTYRGVIGSGSSSAIEGDGDLVDAPAFNNLRPLNFPGSGHELLDKHQIGLTVALLFLGAAQRPSGAPRLSPLDPEPHDDVVAFWEKDGGDQVRPLTRDLPPPGPPPDTLTPARRANHSEWMTYLRTHTRQVAPVPSGHQSPGPYAFEREDGSVWIVDTRHGRSVRSSIDAMPYGIFSAGEPEEEHPFIALGSSDDGQTWLMPIERRGKELVPGEAVLAGTYVADREMGVARSTDLKVRFYLDALRPKIESEVWMAFQNQTRLDIYGIQWDAPYRIELPTKAESVFAWPDDTAILQLTLDPPGLHVLELCDEATAWRGTMLPETIARLRDVTEVWSHAGAVDPVVVADDHQGRTMLVLLRAGGPLRSVTLPDGARFRGLRRSNPDEVEPAYQVSFIMPDDADDLRSHRRRTVDFSSDVQLTP